MRRRLLLVTALLAAVAALTLPPPAMSAVLFKGTFGPAGTHTGKGKVTVVTAKNGARYIKLSRDFMAFNSVRLNLYLATTASATKVKNLGLMKASGAQRFLVPRRVNFSTYRYVIAWCIDFNVPITDAVLRAA